MDTCWDTNTQHNCLLLHVYASASPPILPGARQCWPRAPAEFRATGVEVRVTASLRVSHPLRRGLHGPTYEFADGTRPIFTGTAFGLTALDQDRLLSPRLPEPASGCPGPWAAPFAPSSRKQTAVDRLFCRDYFPRTSSYRQFTWVPVPAFIFGTTSCVENIWHIFLLVVQDPLHEHTAFQPPPKSRCVTSGNRIYIPSLALLTTKPHSLCTNALRCTSANNYGINARHWCPYARCGTCPAGRSYNKFEVTDILFVLPTVEGPLPYRIGTTLTQHDCCPQHLHLQCSMIDLLSA